MSDLPPPPPPGIPAKKKGLPPLAWAGIGCGGLILIVGIVVVAVGIFAAKKIAEATKNPSQTVARIVVQSNPEIEKVSENEETGEMTIRVKKTGEQVTLKYSDLAEGKVVVKDAQGNETSLFGGDPASIPAWVPRYPGATEETVVFQRVEPTQITGGISSTTSSSLEDIKAFYEKQAGTLGLTSSTSSSTSLNGNSSFKFGFSDSKRDIQVDGYSTAGSPIKIITTYTEKK